jgi:hypothetical protein
MKTSIPKSNHNRSILEVAIMKGKFILITMCFVLANYGVANADYLLIDQANMAKVSGWHNLSYFKFDQEFTPSLSSMDMVRLALHTYEEEASLRINIRVDSMYGRIIGTSETYLPPGFTGMARFMFASPVPLNPDSNYVIDLELLSGSASIASGFEGGGYSQGLMYINEYNTSTDSSDLIFQTGNVRSNVIKIEPSAEALCGDINSNNRLNIVIYSNDVLDATLVDPESIIFAEAGVMRAGKSERPQCHQKDINHDGLADLECGIDMTQLVIEQDVLSVSVKAEAYDGMIIIGDEVLCDGQN